MKAASRVKTMENFGLIGREAALSGLQSRDVSAEPSRNNAQKGGNLGVSAYPGRPTTVIFAPGQLPSLHACYRWLDRQLSIIPCEEP